MRPKFFPLVLLEWEDKNMGLLSRSIFSFEPLSAKQTRVTISRGDSYCGERKEILLPVTWSYFLRLTLELGTIVPFLTCESRNSLSLKTVWVGVLSPATERSLIVQLSCELSPRTRRRLIKRQEVLRAWGGQDGSVLPWGHKDAFSIGQYSRNKLRSA